MIALILRLLLFACLVMPSTAAAATVNVAVPSFSISLVAFMAAKERGYYREQDSTLTSCSCPRPSPVVL